MPMTTFFGLNQSIFLFLSFELTLFTVQLILAQFSNSLSINSLFYAFWAWVHPPFGLGTQIWSRDSNLVLTVVICEEKETIKKIKKI